jgi:hypothetical protein
MYKGSRNQNASTEVLGAKEESWGYAKPRKFDDQNGESTCGGGYEQYDEKTSYVESEVVIWLR